MKILTKRLKELAEINYDQCTIWTKEPIILTDLKEEFKKAKEIEEVFHIKSMKNWDKEKHIGRILHFVNNPSKIKGIQLDNLVLDGYIQPVVTVEDGNHRIMAALYLDLEWVEVEYGGREDILDYLNGTTNKFEE